MKDNDAEPHVKCTEFLTELYSDGRIFTNTEFETAEALKYIGYLIRLGQFEAFNIPAARMKAEMLAATLISYKRQGRQENVVALVGSTNPAQSQMPIGSLPYNQMVTAPNQLPASGSPQAAKKHWWSRGK